MVDSHRVLVDGGRDMYRHNDGMLRGCAMTRKNKDIKCGECGDILASVGNSNYEGLDPANSLCYPCATGGRE